MKDFIITREKWHKMKRGYLISKRNSIGMLNTFKVEGSLVVFESIEAAKDFMLLHTFPNIDTNKYIYQPVVLYKEPEDEDESEV